MAQPRLLVIDDDEAVLAFVGAVARDLNYNVLAAPRGDIALSAAAAFRPDVILTDLVMPDFDGVQALRELARQRSTARVALMSGVDEKTRLAALTLGRQYGLTMASGMAKPLEESAVRALLEDVRTEVAGLEPRDLLEALESGRIEVRYQPKVSLQSEHFPIMGAEALVRWRHPRLGLLPASRFIALAEESGLVEPMSSWVLSEVLRQLSVWRKAGCMPVCAVNLPAALMLDLQFPDRVGEAIAEAGIAAECLMLEITERTALQDSPAAVDVLTRFRLKGVRLALDDFGTGYASLRDLYRLPFSELKIDRSFITDLRVNAQAETIVRAVIGLASALHMEVCAEGVEDLATAEFLRELGCDTAQGFYFGDALTAAGFEARLASCHAEAAAPLKP